MVGWHSRIPLGTYLSPTHHYNQSVIPLPLNCTSLYSVFNHTRIYSIDHKTACNAYSCCIIQKIIIIFQEPHLVVESFLDWSPEEASAPGLPVWMNFRDKIMFLCNKMHIWLLKLIQNGSPEASDRYKCMQHIFYVPWLLFLRRNANNILILR